MRVYCSSSSESINGVVFDVLVHLKGVLRYNRFVPIEYANEAEKAEAKKLLASAFENQKDITLYKDETSLLHKYPCILNEGNATNSSGLDGPDDCNRSIIGNINRHDPTQPGSSSQAMILTILRSTTSNLIMINEVLLGATGLLLWRLWLL
ncbi:calmodulin-binding protein 60 A-like [Forsythia ovata]|uniref:Calmodulin-binding protein 60 A-like n=1 Tax=Forsythia ovata TaxID=205694 RepID=A0ABD1TSV1_9LAMI